MGTGDAQSVPVLLHNGAPGLCTLINGYAPGHCTGYLRVIVVNSGGANNQLGVLQILRGMTYGNRDPLRAQMLYGFAFRHIRTLHAQAHAVKYLRQGAHGYSANTCQMNTDAGP